MGERSLARRMCHSVPTVIALSGGIVVPVAGDDDRPETIDPLPVSSTAIGALMGAGFLTFFLCERLLVLHHRDEPADARAHGEVGTFGALGLSAHSLIDGLAVGLAFGANTSTGVFVLTRSFPTSFADGLNAVSFVLNQSQDRAQAIRWLVTDAVAALVGATVCRACPPPPMRPSGTGGPSTPGASRSSGQPTSSPASHEHASWGRVGITFLGVAAGPPRPRSISGYAPGPSVP